MTDTDPRGASAGTIPHCYRHTDRETYISCQRCGRPICPDCMQQASVGFQCPECVKAGQATTRQARTPFGGSLNGGSAILTMVLIGLNAAFFLVANATGGTSGGFVKTMILIPDVDAPRLGLEGVAQGSYWQLISSTFLHVQVLHIVLNMVGLWIFGSFLEAQLGRWRFLALYLLTGLAGSVCVYWLAPEYSLSLGASGSVFGLFGAALLVLLRQHRDVSQLLVLLALNLALTFTVRGISWQAHLGGLAAGLGLGAAFVYAPRQQRTAVHATAVGGLLVVCVALVAARTAILT
ncbi:MAG: rhomboid family intramembrane serine protease [Nocardioidaceae bacterium]